MIFTWSIYRWSIVFWTPWGTINIYVIGVEAKCFCFDGIVDCSIQHSNASDFWFIRNTNSTNVVKCNGCNLASASGSVLIVAIISGHRIRVVSIDVVRRLWILEHKNNRARKKCLRTDAWNKAKKAVVRWKCFSRQEKIERKNH